MSMRARFGRFSATVARKSSPFPPRGSRGNAPDCRRDRLHGCATVGVLQDPIEHFTELYIRFTAKNEALPVREPDVRHLTEKLYLRRKKRQALSSSAEILVEH